MKSKELKVYNIPLDTMPVSNIDAKPKGLIFFIFILGVISIMMELPNILSIILMGMSIVCYSFMPSVILIEFYNDFLVLKNKADKTMCALIYYDEVASWHYEWSAANDQLVIELTDGSVQKIRAFSKTIFEMQMNHYLKDKKKKNK